MAKKEDKKEKWVGFITPEARALYVNVFNKAERPNGEEAYSIVLLFPKNDPGIKEMKKAILACAKNHKATKDIDPKKLDFCLRDGDEKDDPVFHGHYYMNVWSYYQPGIITKTGRPITDPDDFYSGCWCRASVSFWGYNVAGKAGVSASLNNLMKTKDDDRLGGAIDPTIEFADLIEEDEDKVEGNNNESIEDEDEEIPF